MKTCIALLTDFGLQDHYVGVVKGVILSINPDAQIIDICHNILPQNIKQAAFILANCYSYFPAQTIFLVVVDPGVGSLRKPIFIETTNYFFIAPDNGVLSYVFQKEKILNIIDLSDTRFNIVKKSNTFHGRDVFAPLVAHLSKDLNNFKNIGKIIHLKDLIQLPTPYLDITNKQIIGEIIYHDIFGNLITSIPENILNHYEIENIQTGKIIIEKVCKTYFDVKTGELLAYIGSSGYLEIGIREGNAKALLKDVDKIYVNYKSQ